MMEKSKRKKIKHPKDKHEPDKPKKSSKPVFFLFDGDVTADAIMAAIKEHQKMVK